MKLFCRRHGAQPWIIVLIIWISFSKEASAQGFIGYYNDGVTAFNKGDIRKADSLFTLSIAVMPNGDALFNRGICRKITNDLCGYCTDMYESYMFTEDYTALEHLRADCILKADTTFLTDEFVPTINKEKYRYCETRIQLRCKWVGQGRILELKTRRRGASPSTYWHTLPNSSSYSYRVVGRYYMQDSSRVFTQFMGKQQPDFKGDDEELVMNQLRELVVRNQPKLTERYGNRHFPMFVQVNRKGSIAAVHFDERFEMDKTEYAKIKDVLRSMIIRNFELPKSNVFDKPEIIEYILML